MKKCMQCGNMSEDQVAFCGICGSSEFVADATPNEQPLNAPTFDTPLTPEAPVTAEEGSKHGDILKGILGSFLFSLLGGLLYFVIYQLGYIAGISGVAIFFLSLWGYQKFAKPNSFSIVGIITTIVITIIMIYVSEYFCFSFEIFKEFEGELSLLESINATPYFLEDPELKGFFNEELAMAYGFSAFTAIISLVKSKFNK